MSNNSRHRYELQLPSASNVPSPPIVVEAPQPPAVAAPAPQVVVAAPAVQSSSKQSQKPKPDISLDDTLQMMLPAFSSPHHAVERLYAAWCEGGCHLWCEGNQLDPNYIRRLLTVEAQEVDGRWRAVIKPVKGENWDKSTYNWGLLTVEVTALLADLSSDADPEVVEQLIEEKVSAAVAELPAPKDGIDGRDGAVGPVGPPGKDADPEVVERLIDKKLSAAVKANPPEMATLAERKRGPIPKKDWPFVVVGEAYAFRKEHGTNPSAGKLAEICEAKTGYLPDESAIRRVFRLLSAEHLLGSAT